MSPLLVDRQDANGAVVVFVTLNRPDRLNAVDRATLQELQELGEALTVDEEVRAVIFAGAGSRAFSAGADVTMFHDLTRADAVELMRYGQRVFGAIEALPMPTIAAISGYALGGGLELALACDIRIATPTSILGQPEITLANLPGWGGTQRLPRAIGESAALDLILSGRRIDGVEALRLGLVTRLADDAIAAAYSLAAEIGAHAPKAARLAKQAIQKARYSAPDGYLFEREAVGQCFGTAEQLAALEKFRSRSAAERNGR